jgi:DNA-directed RNA polymerase sigma subunit (sigma70/sigma32)
VDVVEMRDHLEVALKGLSWRQREVIRLRFGLGDEVATYSLSEVGRILKLSSERTRQIEAQALRKLASTCPHLEQLIRASSPSRPTSSQSPSPPASR